MNTYYILEDNFERLEKKLARIKNKCDKYNYTFFYKQLAPVYKEVDYEDSEGQKIVAKFIPVEVFGEVKHQDWRFVATLNHNESGNIIRQFDTELEIPDRYRTTTCVCEHCNTRRNRKDTYIVYNDTTAEFKQVGKSCLTEYTRGLSAELVASYIAMFDTMIEGYAPYTGVRPTAYYSVKQILAYAHECVKHFGFWRTDSERSTRSRCMDYYLLLEEGWAPTEKSRQRLHEELDQVKSFDPNRPDVLEFVDASLQYVKDSTDTGSYMHNMKVICSEEYTSGANLGILVSLIPTYMKAIDREAEKKAQDDARAAEAASSDYVGNVGDRITFSPESSECVYSTDTMYGYSWLYKFVDEDNNVYMWWSSSGIDQDKDIESITGTVKSHEEYKGVKQTFLTRCRITYVKK